MDLVYAKALRLTFFECLYLCNHTFNCLHIWYMICRRWNVVRSILPPGGSGDSITTTSIDMEDHPVKIYLYFLGCGIYMS